MMAANPNPAPDPGNSPPEDWTEDLDPAELEQILERLRRETTAHPEGGND